MSKNNGINLKETISILVLSLAMILIVTYVVNLITSNNKNNGSPSVDKEEIDDINIQNGIINEYGSDIDNSTHSNNEKNTNSSNKSNNGGNSSNLNRGSNSSNSNKLNNEENSSSTKNPPNGKIKSSVSSTYGFTYLEGIYPVNSVSDNYTGTCEIQTKETTASTSRIIYYYKWNYNTGKYEKVETTTKGIKYINTTKTDGIIYIQWYLEIDGTKYYTPIYRRNCTESEIAITSSYISSINSKYSAGNTTTKSVEESIILTTRNYQYTLKEYNSSSIIKNNVLKDIQNKYVFTAPHSVKQLREGGIKDSDLNTGPMCESIAKITNSVCISRKYYDATDPNYDSYNNSRFQKLVVEIVGSKNIRLLVDIHGLSDNHPYRFAIGTRNGTTLYSGDKCTLEKKLASSLNAYNSNIKISLNSYTSCNLSSVTNSYPTTQYTGGSLIVNVKNNVYVTKFSAVQLEISKAHRTNQKNYANVIDSIYTFIKNY